MSQPSVLGATASGRHDAYSVLEQPSAFDLYQCCNWIVSDAQKVSYVTDIEGNWNYFCNFVELSDVVNWSVAGDHRQAKEAPELILQDGWHFVFGGDSCDKGPGSLRCLQALVQLKKRYPDRVHLLMGNRDINKMRFSSEITAEEVHRLSPSSPAAFWVPENKRVSPWQYLRRLVAQTKGITEDSVTDCDIRNACTQSNLLRYHLKEDMGSDGEFEFRRSELAHMWGRNEQLVSDADVILSYEKSVAPGGVMREYLELAELACLLGSTLFVHGQLIGKQYTDCGHEDVAWAIGCVPRCRGEGFDRVDDLRLWVHQLNQFARDSVAEWGAKSTWQKPPVDATAEGWSGRGGAKLIAYGTPGSQVPSVVYGRWLEDNCMPKAYPKELVEYLSDSGVDRVIVGHTPHGNCPTVIPHIEGLTVLMADTSFSQMKSDLAYTGDNRGDAVCEVTIEGARCSVRGRTDTGRGAGPRQVIQYKVPGRTCGDQRIGMVQPVSEEVPANERFFVKAFLPALEGQPGRYLLCKVDGFTNTYQEGTGLDVDRVFLGSGAQLERNESRISRVTSHGDECPGVDEIAEHIFRRLDRDHDGGITVKELIAACSREEVRTALAWTFPDARLEDIFADLDADQDGQVTREEFRRRFTSESLQWMASYRGESPAALGASDPRCFP